MRFQSQDVGLPAPPQIDHVVAGDPLVDNLGARAGTDARSQSRISRTYPVPTASGHCPRPASVVPSPIKIHRQSLESGSAMKDACRYRFENWNRLRAPGWPDFLRSFMRGSRVSKPSSRSEPRRFSSLRSSARLMATAAHPPVRRFLHLTPWLRRQSDARQLGDLEGAQDGVLHRERLGK